LVDGSAQDAEEDALWTAIVAWGETVGSYGMEQRGGWARKGEK
jgi:hypothetical protein